MERSYELDLMESSGPKVSITGLALRIPGASHLSELSTLLKSNQKVDGPMKQGDNLDRDFFNISPDGAHQCHPLLGPLLEVTAECIMDSGITFKDISKKRTGFYLQSNVGDTYKDLTSRVVSNFNMTGPVVDFAGYDISPANIVYLAFSDLMCDRCDHAIVVGIYKQNSPSPGNEGNECHENQSNEGIAAMMLKVNKMTLIPFARVYCDIISFSLSEEAEQKPATIAESSIDDCKTQNKCEDSNSGLFRISPGQSTDIRWKKRFQLPCSNVFLEMFKSSHPISLFVGVMACISLMVSKDCDDGRKRKQKSEFKEDQILCVKIEGINGQQHEMILKEKKTVTKNLNTGNLSAVIPTTVHPLKSTDDAERTLREYENDQGFLYFLANSELSKGLKGPLLQLHYFFKLPGFSHFPDTNFTVFEEIPVIVVFEDFLLSPWIPTMDILNLPAVEKSITRFDNVLRDEGMPNSVLKTLKLGTIPIPTSAGGTICRVAVQMAVVDLLICVHSKKEIHTIVGSGLGSIAAAYADGALTFIQAVKVSQAIEISFHIAKKKLKDKLILDVFCSNDEVYQLGPWVRILYHFPQGVYRIAAPTDKRNAIINTLRSRGLAHREYLLRTPLYTPVFGAVVSGLGRILNDIIPMPSMWSAKIKIVGLGKKEMNSKKCSSLFFTDLLCTPFNTDLELKRKYNLPTKTNNLASNVEINEAKKEITIAEKISNFDKNLERNKHLLINQVSTPLKELEGNGMLMDCSTNAVKGSFLCPSSIRTESASSVSDPQTEEMSEMLSSHLASVKKKASFLYLHFFSLKNKVCAKSEEDSSTATESSSSGSSVSSMGGNNEPVHKDMEANQYGLLQSLAWIHGTGNRMEAERQFRDAPMHCLCYHGDFVMQSLWAWNKEAHPSTKTTGVQPLDRCAKENVTMYSLTTKPRLKDSILLELINSRSPGHLSDSFSQQMHFGNVPNFLCAFDLNLLLLSGYKWIQHLNQVIPACSTEMAMEDLKMQKQVKFSYDKKKGCFEAKLKDSDKIIGELNWSTMAEGSNKIPTQNSLQSMTNSGILLAALNKVHSEEFSFVSMLQVDESLEKYLLDILTSFPFNSSLHIFITQKMNATCSSKYVINVSRRACFPPVNEEVYVLLRDRSTDQMENCSSITKALSIISSFEDDLYDNYLARVFEFPLLHADDTFSFNRLEFMIFDKERQVARSTVFDFDKENYISSSSSSSSSDEIEEFADAFDDMSDYAENSLSSGITITTENISSNNSQQESFTRNVNNAESTNTSFRLNLDETFVQTFHKLAKLNKHTIAYIEPKFQNEISNENNASGEKHLAEGIKDLKKEEMKEMSEGLPHNVPKSLVQEKENALSNKPIYMISVKESSGQQIFMYSRKSREISRWLNIENVIEELKVRHPKIQDDYQALVTKFDDEFSFEELLHVFMYDSKPKQNTDNNGNPTSIDNIPIGDVDVNQGQENESTFIISHDNQNSSSNDFSEQKTTAAQTPHTLHAGFVIPEIIITPPGGLVRPNHTSLKDLNLNKQNETNAVACPEMTATTSMCSIPTDTLCKPLEIQSENKSYSKSSQEEENLNDSHTNGRVNKSILTTDKSEKLIVTAKNDENSSQLLNQDSSDKPKHLSQSSTNEDIENDEKLSIENMLKLSEEIIVKAQRKNRNSLSPSKIQFPDITLKSEEPNNLLNSSKENVLKENGCNGENHSVYKTADNTMTSCLTKQSEENSDKENTILCVEDEMNDILEALTVPRNEGLDFLAQFKVTNALIVHLTDQISSFHDQKGRASGNLLLYLAKGIVDDDNEHRDIFLGLVLFDDMDIRHSRFRIPDTFDDSNLESALNCLLSWYILRVLACVSKASSSQINAIVQSPIQRDSAAIMLVASYLGCKKVVTCSSVEEIKEDLLQLVPRSVVLDGRIDGIGVLPLVGVKGVDVIIMLRQQELGEMLDLLACSGRLVLCGEVDRTEEVDVAKIPHNCQITKFDVLSAVRYLTTMEENEKMEFEEEFFNLLSSKLSCLNEFYPSAREGYFYQIIGQITVSSLDEQPLENVIHDLFFSTTSTLQQVLESIPGSQRKTVEEIFTLMAMPPGDDGDTDLIMETLLP